MSRRGSDVRTNVLDADNGTSYEGRLTDRANNQDYLYFYIQDNFANGISPNMQIKVTYLDAGTAQWQLHYRNSTGTLITDTVTNTNSNNTKTATFDLVDANFDNGMTAGADFRLYNGGSQDIEVRFVRLIRLTEPLSDLVFSNGFES